MATSKYGVKTRTLKGKTQNPGSELEIEYFIRKEKEKTRFAPVPNIGRDDILLLDTLRSLCKQLNIPPQAFGLNLG